MVSTRFARIAALALLACAPAACKSYKYMQVNATLDPTTFTFTDAFRIHICHVFVTGTDNDNFHVTARCPPPATDADRLNIGTFEFHTLEDSGTDTFTMKVFEGNMERPECLLGQGMVSVPVGGTAAGGNDLVVDKTANGCPNGPGPQGVDANFDFGPSD
jgi:hypothetical protein